MTLTDLLAKDEDIHNSALSGLRNRSFSSNRQFPLHLDFNVINNDQGPHSASTTSSNPLPPPPLSAGAESSTSTGSIRTPTPTTALGAEPTSPNAESSSAAGSGSKEKRKRSRVTPEQLVQLERIFVMDKSPTAQRRKEISEMLGMQERQTQIWFQNRYIHFIFVDNAILYSYSYHLGVPRLNYRK